MAFACVKDLAFGLPDPQGSKATLFWRPAPDGWVVGGLDCDRRSAKWSV